MSARLPLLALLALAGCSPPPIVSAAEAIAELRGCEPEALTLQERTEGGYDATSCGAPASYLCTGATCLPLENTPLEVDERVQEAGAHMASVDADLAACAEGQLEDGERLVVRAQFDAAGLADGLALRPTTNGDVRACVARLVMPIELGPGRGMLVSYTVGQPATAPQPSPGADVIGDIAAPEEEGPAAESDGAVEGDALEEDAVEGDGAVDTDDAPTEQALEDG